MQSLLTLSPANWGVYAEIEKQAFTVGQACGTLWRSKKTAAVNYSFAGRLYLSKSGWLLLSVPNSLVQGVFDALQIPGAELPLTGAMNVPGVPGSVLNAHISVMTPEEVEKIGASKITERGQTFRYSLGKLKEHAAKNIAGVSRLWVLDVKSPELATLRKAYGLPPKLRNYDFHITVAIRKTKVLQNGPEKKSEELLEGGAADNKPDSAFDEKKLQEGVTHEREHTEKDQVAKEIAKDHLHEDADYYKKVKEIEKGAASLPSAYLSAASKSLRPDDLIRYDTAQTPAENLVGYLQRVKARGDFTHTANNNYQKYLMAADPKYRDMLAQQAIAGKLQTPSLFDQAVQRYGDGALAQLRGYVNGR